MLAGRLTVGIPGLDMTTDLIVILRTIRANTVVTFVNVLACYHILSLINITDPTRPERSSDAG